MKQTISELPPLSVPRMDSLLHRLQHAPGAEDQPYLDQLMIFLDSGGLDPHGASGLGGRVRFPATESRLATGHPAVPLTRARPAGTGPTRSRRFGSLKNSHTPLALLTPHTPYSLIFSNKTEPARRSQIA